VASKPILFALLVTVFAISQLRAQNQPLTKLPDTPAGRQFQKFLEAIESGDHREYITSSFNQQFLEAFPLSDHIDFFRQVSTMHGGLTPYAIETASEYEIVVLAKSKKRDAWRRLDMSVEPEPPHKVAGLGIDVADPPAGATQPVRKMSEAEIIAFAGDELRKMAREDTFSGAVLIAKDGRPLFREAFGLASKEFDVPNRADTRFNIGSINKSFTEMAIAQLLEKELIGLDDPIGKHLSGLPPDIGAGVTIRHLLTMRSGMGSYWNEEWQERWATIKTIDDLMEIIKKIPLDFEPGTGKQYSNSGFVVLGAILEAVTGRGYYDYVRDSIFSPIGMNSTDSYELDQIVPNLAVGYTYNRSESPYNGNKRQNNLFIHAVKDSPAGGGYSTLDDLNLYVEALKSNALAGERYTNLVLDLYQNADNPDRRPVVFGIAGGAPVGINAVIEADLTSGYTVIVLSNYDPPVAEEFGSRLFKLLRNMKN
jgi:D-alanyl-D-alanine carboxypeptidase